MIRFRLAGLLGLAFVVLSSPLAAQGPVLRGTVLTEQGAPIAGARVAVGARAAVTDPAGAFSLTGLPTGAVTVTAARVGYRPVSRTLTLAAGENRIELRLPVLAIEMEGLEVVSLRTLVPVSAVPGAVSVVGREALETQAALSSNVGDMLAQVVPGLGAAIQSPSLNGQALRGRNISVLIDGVPQSTSRNVMRDLSTIDPAMIERVEVLRGATALYGDGATGGVINIVTRAPVAGRSRLTTSVMGEGAASSLGDGLGGRLSQSVAGRSGAVDYLVSGSASRVGDYFDAEGDLIPSDPHGQGGLAETRSHDLFAKLGYTAGAGRLQLMLNRLVSRQETDYVSDPALNRTAPYSVKARPLAGLTGAEDQGTENTVASLDFSGATVLGSRLHAQGFFRDYRTVFSPYDARSVPSRAVVMQSWLESQRFGGRLEMETPLAVLGEDASVLWGADYSREKTSQPVHIYDAAQYDSSGGMVFVKTGERVWVPVIRPTSLGLFAQVAVRPFERLQLRGGVRHERATLEVPDFTTLNGNLIQGGELRFDPTLLNVGAVVTATDAVSVYGSFSQGFSLTDIGLALRDAPAGATLQSREMQAQTVDQYEVGVRGAWRPVQASLAAFRTSSELGTTSAGYNQPVVRAPERVYGIEATLDVEPMPRLGVGGTFSWTEGESFVSRDSAWHALNSFRVQPLKVTAYARHQTLPGWDNRLQVLYSGARDRAFDDRANPAVIGFGERPVESYWVADYVSSVSLGRRGRVDIGVQNLLNKQYFPVVSQLLRSGGNSSYTAARGRSISVGYTVTY